MSQSLNRTKIIATYGPAMDKLFKWDLEKKPKTLTNHQIDVYKKLVEAGLSVIRFNFSHDSLANHEYRFYQFRQLMHKTKLVIGILIDTKGPEIRVGRVSSRPSNNLIKKGSKVELLTKTNIIGNAHKFYLSDSTHDYNLANDLQVGDHVLIDDGKLVLEVLSLDVKLGKINTKSLSNDYTISSNKRVNLFNKKYSLPFLSDYDIQSIILATKLNADFLALSFVSDLEQVNAVKSIINQHSKDSNLKIICKIEIPEAVKNLDDLILNTDGIMVARGDLSLEIGFAKVPAIQDLILRKCNQYNKISIVATQMLDSLETKIFPTRAEVTDCYYATKSFCDSTMLSSESAAGVDPINAIKVMAQIATQTEEDLGKVINFDAYYQHDKFLKKMFKKINNNTLDFSSLWLKGFNEIELRWITNTLTNKTFYVDQCEYENITTFTLYKNIHFFHQIPPKNAHLLEKK